MSDLPELPRPRDTERERIEIALRLEAPKRSPVAQADVDHTPLFVAANEPRMI